MIILSCKPEELKPDRLSIRDRVKVKDTSALGGSVGTVDGFDSETVLVVLDGDVRTTCWKTIELELISRPEPVVTAKPTVVCLCGSTRFSAAYQRANLEETLAGRIVLTIGCDLRSDVDLFKDKSPDELAAIKRNLDKLHLSKIDLADEILVLNVGGYVGESTKSEIEYARLKGKTIRWLEPEGEAVIKAILEAEG